MVFSFRSYQILISTVKSKFELIHNILYKKIKIANHVYRPFLVPYCLHQQFFTKYLRFFISEHPANYKKFNLIRKICHLQGSNKGEKDIIWELFIFWRNIWRVAVLILKARPWPLMPTMRQADFNVSYKMHGKAGNYNPPHSNMVYIYV